MTDIFIISNQSKVGISSISRIDGFMLSNHYFPLSGLEYDFRNA